MADRSRPDDSAPATPADGDGPRSTSDRSASGDDRTDRLGSDGSGPDGLGRPDGTDDAGGPGTEPLLSVRNLRTSFDVEGGRLRAVDGVSFDVRPGETVCLVGESGSGKTVACESITRLVGGRIEGEVLFDGEDLTDLSPDRLREYRGGRIGHVFQNLQGALDPVYTVGRQVTEAVDLHRDLSTAAARERAVELLDRVGIGDAEERFDDYPHQLSGGMKQRVVVAMALACDPDLLIADEPTTALDVTIQAQVLDLLSDLQEERGMAVLFVTHDLGVVAQLADRVVVMYAGRVMESGDVRAVFERPAHPYTRALLDCLPGRGRSFETIPGRLPDPTDPPAGCRFHPRCPHAVAACERGDHPGFESVDAGDSTATGVAADRSGAGDPGADPTVGRPPGSDGTGPVAGSRDAGSPPNADDGSRPGGDPSDGPADRGAPDGRGHRVACLLYGDDHRLPPELWEGDR